MARGPHIWKRMDKDLLEQIDYRCRRFTLLAHRRTWSWVCMTSCVSVFKVFFCTTVTNVLAVSATNE